MLTSHDAHLFYLVTPDHPDEINIKGVPAGTKEFTIGAYNRGGFLGIGNKLTPEFGYDGGPVNTDTPYLLGEAGPTSRMTITPPDGTSDTELINRLGSATNEIKPISYFTFGQTGRFGNANSNNFVNEIGTRAGVGNQVNSFDPKNVYIPGKNNGLPTSSIRQDIQSQIQRLIQQVADLKAKIDRLLTK